MKYLAGVAAVTGLDIVLKRWVDKHIDLQEEKKLAGGRIILQKHYNEGALFDSLIKRKEQVYSASYVLLGVLAGLFASEQEKSFTPKRFGMALLLGGAVSNSLDRLQLGHVIDYCGVAAGRLKNVVFNLGDVMILTGSAVWALAGLFGKGEAKH